MSQTITARASSYAPSYCGSGRAFFDICLRGFLGASTFGQISPPSCPEEHLVLVGVVRCLRDCCHDLAGFMSLPIATQMGTPPLCDRSQLYNDEGYRRLLPGSSTASRCGKGEQWKSICHLHSFDITTPCGLTASLEEYKARKRRWDSPSTLPFWA